MFYAKILNNEVVEYPYISKNENESDCVEVELTPIPICEINQNFVFDGIEFVNNAWRQKWRIESATQQQIEIRQMAQEKIAKMSFEELASIA